MLFRSDLEIQIRNYTSLAFVSFVPVAWCVRRGFGFVRRAASPCCPSYVTCSGVAVVALLSGRFVLRDPICVVFDCRFFLSFCCVCSFGLYSAELVFMVC